MRKILLLLMIFIFVNVTEVFSQGRTAIQFHITNKSYKLDDLVAKNGSIYKCTTAGVQTPPGANWEDITESLTETDPVYIADPAFGITAPDITNWNTAFGWGDHSIAGYLTDPHGLVELNETNGIGYVTNQRIPAANGNIGFGAFDFQATTLTLTDNAGGATGEKSITFGRDNDVSGYGALGGGWVNTVAQSGAWGWGTLNNVNGFIALGWGQSNSVTGDFSIGMGYQNTILGEYSFALGNYNNMKAYGVGIGTQNFADGSYATAIGTYNTDYTENSLVAWDNADRVFSIGTGDTSGTRKDGMVIMKNQEITFPELTDALIISGGNQSPITKGYADANYSGTSESTTASNGLNLNGVNVEMGGAITGNIDITNTADNMFSFSLGDGASTNLDLDMDSGAFDLNWAGATRSSRILLNGVSGAGAGITLLINNGTNTNSFTMSTAAGWIVQDAINNKGLVYSNDYKANFTDLSIVNKNYVDEEKFKTVTSGSYTTLEADLDKLVILGSTANGLVIDDGAGAIRSNYQVRVMNVTGVDIPVTFGISDFSNKQSRIKVLRDGETLTARMITSNVWYLSLTSPEVIESQWAVACSDLTTSITTGTSKAYFRMPYKAELIDVKVSLLTAGTATGIVVDINESGTSILHATDKLKTDATEGTSETYSGTAVNIIDSALADDAVITIDFDTVPTAGAGVIVTFYWNRV
jgi:hypothetical protein